MNDTVTAFFRSVDDAPVRTWSLIVTIYGDCVMPRGGELWLGTLTEILGAIGVEAGSVRTAMSRLARDGFLERRRRGRTSHYALAPSALTLSRDAEARIYRTRPFETGPGWDLMVTTGTAAPGRKRLRALGYEPLVPGLFVRPRRDGPVERVGEAVHLSASGDDAALAAALYPLPLIAARYRAFARAARTLGPAAVHAAPLDALALRVALVHAFRRIVLRDPSLPASALPPGWPAVDAFATFAAVYRALEPASDAWLDTNARNAAGPLPAPDTRGRFADAAAKADM